MSRQPHRYAGRDDVELLLVIDCADLNQSAEFWCNALGYERFGSPVGQYLGLVPASGSGLEILLQRVSETKVDKNRLHLDLRSPDAASELARLKGLGAKIVSPEPMRE